MTEKDYKQLLKDKLIKYRPSLNLPKDVTFGIEIEYENVPNEVITHLIHEEELYNNSFNNWINKYEPDLYSENISDKDEVMNGEISSPILRDKIKTWKTLRTSLDILNKNGAIVTDRCGGHVNIGAHILGDNVNCWRNFILLWILYEKEIYKFSSGEFKKVRIREEDVINRIKPSFKSNLFMIIELAKKKYKSDIYNYLSNVGMPLFEKTFDISLNNFSGSKFKEDNRLEFRLPNGTLKEEIWQNYINFFAKFLLACKKELDIDQILYKIGNNEHSVIELADFVFEDNIDKENFLIQALKTDKIYKKELPEHIAFY